MDDSAAQRTGFIRRADAYAMYRMRRWTNAKTSECFKHKEKEHAEESREQGEIIENRT